MTNCRAICVIILSLFPLISLSQSNLDGYVKDDSGTALYGASIRVINGLKGTATDESGYFLLKNLPKGDVILEFSFLGFKSLIDTISVQEISDPVNIEMQVEPFLADEFIVSATRVEENDPISHTNLTREQIDEMNTGRDIPYIISQTPSVVSTSDAGAGIGYTGLRIRGIDQTNINVTINGIPMNDAESHGVYWVDIPDFASSLSDLQIQRGVGTSTNGSGAFGSSINLQTEQVNVDPYLDMGISAGSFNTSKISFRMGTGLLFNLLSIEGRYSEIKSDGYVDRASTDMSSYFLALTLPGEKYSLKLLAFGGKERTYQAWYGVDSSTLATDRTNNSAGVIYDENWNEKGYYDNEIDHYIQDHIQLHFTAKFSDHLRLTLAGHLTHGAGYYEQYRSNDSLGFYGIQDLKIGDTTIKYSDIVVRQWLDNLFYGFTFNLNFQKGNTNLDIGGAANQYDGDHFGEIRWARYSSSSSLGDEYYRNKGVKDDFNIYAKITQKLSKKLTSFLDVQFRYVSYNAEGTDEWAPLISVKDALNFVNPKLGLNYHLNPKNEFYYTFGVANREPNRNDYLASVPEIAKPQRLLDEELGYRYKFASSWVQSNVYFMYYVDQLVLTGEINNVGEPLRANSGKSYRMGLEISAGVFLFNRLLWRPNVTISQNKNLDYKILNSDGTISSEETDIAFSPNFIGNNSFQYQPFDFLYLTLYSNYVGDQFLDNSSSNKLKLKAYHVHDFRVEVKHQIGSKKTIGFFCMINNLLDAKYESNGYVYGGTPYYFPQAGTNFMCGLNLKL